jgi:hypothetical protein
MNQKFFEIKYISESNTVNNILPMILALLQPTRSKSPKLRAPREPTLGNYVVGT